MSLIVREVPGNQEAIRVIMRISSRSFLHRLFFETSAESEMEDEGEIIGVDDCPCGRMGTYFKVFGRIQNAETRGCSDTYTQ
jgi:hypothetical protein